MSQIENKVLGQDKKIIQERVKKDRENYDKTAI